MKKRKMFLAALLTVSLVVPANGTITTQNTQAKNLKKASFAYLDVGQGNAELIKVGSKSILIDTGKKSEYSALKGQLKKLNVKTIQTLVVSHPDADHMESADQIISNYHVKTIICPKITSNTQCYKRMTASVKKYRVKQIHPAAGQKIKLAPSCNAQVLSADASSSDKNEASIVMRVTYGSRAFLYMGDATSRVENTILAKKYKVASDVYLLSHHGSDTANGVLFVKKALSAKYKAAVISVGADNSYGHPVKQVVNRAQKYADKVYRTDKNGMIIFTTNGNTLNSKCVSVTHTHSSSSYNTNASDKSSIKENPAGAKISWVYVTKTGKKYHRAGCRYLRVSKIKIKLKDARKKGYTACKMCF